MKEKGINPSKGRKFSPVPNGLMRRREVSMGAKIVYGRLNQYAGIKTVAFPGLDRIANEVGTSKSSAIKYIKELERHGLIYKERKGLGRTNRYHFVTHEWMSPAKRPSNYAEYLQSDHWKDLSEKKRKEAKYLCQLCNEGGILNVHHRTYDNLGNEDLADLIVLCEPCHGKFHDIPEDTR